MKACVLGLIGAGLTLSGALAADARLEAALRRLEPDTRLEQVCDIAVMQRIKGDTSPYRPDKVLAGAISEPRRSGDSLDSEGGAFRSGGHWYRLSFECQASPDRMRVLSLNYTIGEQIPVRDWDDYGLYP
ncbi:DUF930 domain-containing protein [Phreatobacter stygius]|uniref:DUF930 domain-containing protein n=2 Tax=Phreatobacter stygius TaxID=1940610 RepID=A0A4D7BFQ5_9HYPH|nr:DUF930 domain-containing protein [Phreatobacter stygius]